jgi:orotate phosphoribosyltransferase
VVSEEERGRSAREPISLEKDLTDSGAVRFGTFTLASGATSDVYVDVKKAWTDPKRLHRIALRLAERSVGAQMLAGMELGAVPLVVATALETGTPYVVIRKAAKAHGTRARYEGEIAPGTRMVLLEDVTTSGGSVADSIAVLREAGAVVEKVVTVVDREQGAAEKLQGLGVRMEALTTLRLLRGSK